ncbi:hypothetical protein ACFX2V_13440 [Gilliamella apicola]|uniref:hypothetical protein n=1 Tax=Gilliamella apicola TaxID=1196095 RepID=UPI003985BA73
MSDNTKISTTFSGLTTVIKKGEVAIQQVMIKIPPKPLFVLFAYGGKTGAREMKLAAEYKKRRLEKKYPTAEIRIIHRIKWPSHFKAEWTKLYIELTRPETANKYSLWQIHFFGHGEPESLCFEPDKGIAGAKSQIFFDESDKMAPLPWHPREGIFVLHACLTAAFEATLNEKKIKAQTCIANTISKNQKTRCLGQTIGANYNVYFSVLVKYNPDDSYQYPIYRRKEITTTARQDAEEFKYRTLRPINYVLNEKSEVDRVLWGYALLKGEAYTHAENHQIAYKRLFKKSYPMYEEIKILGPKGQIMPCRVFNNGVLENRIVKAGYFNNNDLEYI